MSRSKDEIIIKFNIRISYRLHVLYIVSTIFDNTTFGKTNLLFGLFLYPHLFNIFNLIYYLYCGYSEFNKDNPLNMKIEIINELYKILIK